MSACAQTNQHKAVDPGAAVIPERIYDAKQEKAEGSLWPGDTSDNLLFRDTKARKTGDIVTVLIEESATSSQSATTETEKESEINLETNNLLGLPSNLGIQNFMGMGTPLDPNLGASTNHATTGEGTTSRQGTFNATISAVITRVLPNGNFEIEGKRAVKINNEEQIMVLRGMIRPTDIGFDNTISSRFVADAAITYYGNGVVADEQRVGWGTRILGFIWPF